jgi:hypothetical protein
LNTSERSMQMRVASYRSWANTADRSARTAPARKRSHHDRFVDQARAKHPGASDKQIEQAAAALKSAYYTDLARRSAITRRIKAGEKKAAKAKRAAQVLAEAGQAVSAAA